jgi:transcriptional regulator with XRE-family HTH domain
MNYREKSQRERLDDANAMQRILPFKLKEMRERTGLSIEEVCTELCIFPFALASFEMGESVPTVSVLLSLAELYECSLDTLFGRQFPCEISLTKTQLQLLYQLLETLK